MTHAYPAVTLTVPPTVNRAVYQALTMQAHAHVQAVRNVGIAGATATPEQIEDAVAEVRDYAARWSPEAREAEIAATRACNGPAAIEAHYQHWCGLSALAAALDPAISVTEPAARGTYAIRVAAALDAPRTDPVQAERDMALVIAVAAWADLEVAALRRDGAARAAYEAEITA